MNMNRSVDINKY